MKKLPRWKTANREEFHTLYLDEMKGGNVVSPNMGLTQFSPKVDLLGFSRLQESMDETNENLWLDWQRCAFS